MQRISRKRKQISDDNDDHGKKVSISPLDPFDPTRVSPKNFQKFVRADRRLLTILSDASKLLAMNISRKLKRDDPGILVQIVDEASLHTALGLPGSPIAQGATVLESLSNFRTWIVDQALASPGVNINNQEPPNTESMAFHHISDEQANHIVYRGWHHIPWAVELQNHPEIQMPIVLWLTGTGKGKARMFQANQVLSYVKWTYV